MHWLSDPGYWASRLVFTRGLAAIDLVAFVSALRQFRPLLGSSGMLPVPRFVARTSFRRSPSLFHLHWSDRFFAACCIKRGGLRAESGASSRAGGLRRQTTNPWSNAIRTSLSCWHATP